MHSELTRCERPPSAGPGGHSGSSAPASRFPRPARILPTLSRNWFSGPRRRTTAANFKCLLAFALGERRASWRMDVSFFQMAVSLLVLSNLEMHLLSGNLSLGKNCTVETVVIFLGTDIQTIPLLGTFSILDSEVA